MTKMNALLKNQGAKTTPGAGVIQSTARDAVTGNGSPAFSRTAKSDLFLLAVTNFVGEQTFYEQATARDTRFQELVHQVTREDAEWMQKFIPWLRNEANMRTASLVAAAEYVKAGGPNGRSVVVSAIARADEPAELVAYWLVTHGRRIPQPIKRGVADAAQTFYTERNVLKYDSNGAAVRMADVLQLTHVKPKADWQSILFKYLLASRYDNDDEMAEYGVKLPMLSTNLHLRTIPREDARHILLTEPETMRAAGMTWESLSSYGAMDKAAWEAVIPNMGYMALLRNLRNFDEAGVSDQVAQGIVTRLSDPDEVTRSRQLPFRFYSAYKNAPSLRWSYALEQALDLATQNVPEFSGKTLVLVDTSGSMGDTVSAKSTATRVEMAGLFGAVLAKRNAGRVRLVQFATSTRDHSYRASESALTIQRSLMNLVGAVGHGTDVARAVQTWQNEDRIIILSDLQTTTAFTRSGGPQPSRGYWGTNLAVKVPSTVPIYGFNLGGYAATPLASGSLAANEHEMGGLTDKTFEMITLIEQAKTARWPWE